MGIDSVQVRHASKEPERESGVARRARLAALLPVDPGHARVPGDHAGAVVERRDADLRGGPLPAAPDPDARLPHGRLPAEGAQRPEHGHADPQQPALDRVGAAISVLSGGMVAMAVAFVGAVLVTLGAPARPCPPDRHDPHPRLAPAVGRPRPLRPAPSASPGCSRSPTARSTRCSCSRSRARTPPASTGRCTGCSHVSAFVPIAVMTTLFPVLSRGGAADACAGSCSSPPSTWRWPRCRCSPSSWWRRSRSSGCSSARSSCAEPTRCRVLMGAFVVICFGYVAGWMTVVLRLQRQFIRYALIALVFNVGPQPHPHPEVRLHGGRLAHARHRAARAVPALRLVFRTLEMRPKFSRFVRITAAAAAAWAGRLRG